MLSSKNFGEASVGSIMALPFFVRFIGVGRPCPANAASSPSILLVLAKIRDKIVTMRMSYKSCGGMMIGVQ